MGDFAKLSFFSCLLPDERLIEPYATGAGGVLDSSAVCARLKQI